MGLTPITEMEFRTKINRIWDKILFTTSKKRIKRTAWFLLNPQTTKKHRGKR